VNATVIVTAAREPRGAARAIAALLGPSIEPASRLLLVAPDVETLEAGIAAGGGRVETLRDLGLGKIRALREAFARAEAELLVLTDGDVVADPDAIPLLLARFRDPSVGCVAARPVPAEARSGLLGTWAHLLLDAAHRMRAEAEERGVPVEPSGYLYAVRRIPPLLESLSGAAPDDVEIAHRLAAAGFRCVYEPRARVVVRNPRTLPDWFRQKARNARGHLLAARLARKTGTARMQSFAAELRLALRAATAPRDALRLAALLLARGAAWSWARLTLPPPSRATFDGWPRIESTKEEA
jgi:GT2 family glycosyltransferase